MSKKLLLFMLVFVLVLVLVLVACSKSNTEPSASNDSTVKSNTNQSSETSKPVEPEAPKETPKSDFPTKPIQLIVPYAAGGITDTATRMLADILPKYLPNNAKVVVVNMEGGGGIIGATGVLNAPVDGYTIGISTHSVLALQPNYGEAPFNSDSFQPLGQVYSNPSVMFVKGDKPYNNFEEWLEFVKANPDTFTYGATAGLGSVTHVPMAMLEEQAGIKMKVVGFPGAAPGIAAVLGGHVDGGVIQPNDLEPYVESGDFKVLFNAGSWPVEFLPDLPTLVDKDYDIAVNSTTVVIAPKGLPEDVQTILMNAMKQAIEDPALATEFQKIKLKPLYEAPEKVQENLNEDYEMFNKVLKSLGMIE